MSGINTAIKPEQETGKRFSDVLANASKDKLAVSSNLNVSSVIANIQDEGPAAGRVNKKEVPIKVVVPENKNAAIEKLELQLKESIINQTQSPPRQTNIVFIFLLAVIFLSLFGYALYEQQQKQGWLIKENSRLQSQAVLLQQTVAGIATESQLDNLLNLAPIHQSIQQLNEKLSEHAGRLNKLNLVANEKVITEKPAPEQKEPTGWVVNLITLSDKKQIVLSQKKLAKTGVDAKIVAAKFKDKRLYRLVVDGFSEQQAARKFQVKIARQKNYKDAWVSYIKS